MRMAGRRAVRSASRGRRLRHLRTFPPGGRHVPLGCPRDRVPVGWSRAVWPARRRVAPCRASGCAPPSGAMAGRFRHLAKRRLPLAPPVIRREEEGAVDAGALFGTGGRLSRGARRLAWDRAGHPPTARDQVPNEGATHDAGPPCVVVISFDGTRRLPSRRFRPASKAVCPGPRRRGCGSGVTARRREDFLWVTSPDLPIGMSSTRRVWIPIHGSLYKTDAFGLCRRVGRS